MTINLNLGQTTYKYVFSTTLLYNILMYLIYNIFSHFSKLLIYNTVYGLYSETVVAVFML